MVYLISYKLNQPGKDYENLYKAIKEVSGVWFHHTTSVWIIESNLSAEQIYNLISSNIIDKNDELIIFRLTGEWWGKLNDATNYDWLKARVF